jgi:hypothetical protein
MQEFFKEAQKNDWKIQLYQFRNNKPYRDTFWEIINSKMFNIVLDVKRENIIKALKQVSITYFI